MAYYALLSSNNIVVQVITGVDENISQVDLDGTTVGGSTEAWEEFYSSRPWFNGLKCKRTSFNAQTNGFRKRYAAIGYIYNETLDAFIPLRPFRSWILNELTCSWEAPVTYPTDGKMYTWNESTLSWDEETE
jgi:hypothetical protein